MFNFMKSLCFLLSLFVMSASVWSEKDGEVGKTLKVGFSEVDSFPFEYMKGDDFVGLHPDMISEVALQEGYNVEFYRLPWKRILSMIEKGELDAVSFIGGYRNSHEATWFYGGNALSINGFYLMTLKDRKDIKYRGDLSMLKPLRIASLRGYNVIEWEKDTLDLKKQVEIIEVDTQAQLEKMLLRGRVDAAIVMRSTLEKKRRGNLKEFRVVARPLNSVYIYLGFSKYNIDYSFVKSFGDAMRRFQNTTEFSRMQKYYKDEKVPTR